MATTALLIEATPLKWKQSTLLGTSRPPPSKPLSYQLCFASSPSFKNPKPPLCYSLPAEKKSHYFTACSKSDHPSLSQCLNVFKDNRAAAAAANPNITTPLISKLLEKSVQALRKPATAAVLLGLVVLYNPNSAALAAPVGRVGGSFTSCFTSSTTTSHNPSENSSTSIETYDFGYYDPLWDSILVQVLVTYLVGVIIVMLATDNKYVCGASCIVWTVIMATWFHSRGQTSVVKLQLQCNLSNTERSLQMDLNRIAEAANPHTQTGLRYVLRDTAIALLRKPDYSISGYSSVVIPKFGRAAAQQCFNKLAVRERVRYDEGTMAVNMDDIKFQSTGSQRCTDESHNDDVVVTILLAAEGKSKSLTITDSSDVIRVLEELASIDPGKRILGVEVLWSTQLSSNAGS